MDKPYLGQKVLVVGAARSGVASAEFLLSRGAHVVLTDAKSEEALTIPLAPLRKLAQNSGELVLELGGHKPGSFTHCDFAVISPGVPLAHPLFEETRKAGIPVLAEVELASRHLKGTILGITGSNGKTTTTTLVAELLRGAGLRGFVAGNIGNPLIGLVSASTPADIYVVELSSFQLESIQAFRPFVGAILNLTPDHLDRYRDFAGYIGAKQRIFMNQTVSDFAVLNDDDTRTAAMAAQVSSTPVLFSRRHEVARGAFVRSGRLVYRDGHHDTDLFPAQEIRLKGGHNLENVLAACAIALLAGAAPGGLAGVVRAFAGVEHRLEFVGEFDGVQYFNDSKATNVDATIKSLEAFPRNIVLIAGGRDKGGDFLPLRPLVAERVKHLIVIGEAAGKIRAALSDAVETSEAESLPDAVQFACRRASPGDIVLLAPACASFDMFKNYEHRGRVFKEAVLRLVRK
ncbi:MAG: UDP-N-acetylmuramoyl-L-alanine--D-glutamate ligase [Acidobacteriia bacterium]|nr:UDP-N-acetylmuramoyl-L-alanine--D-glutamate ligase [Terriglobia bacterium]